MLVVLYEKGTAVQLKQCVYTSVGPAVAELW